MSYHAYPANMPSPQNYAVQPIYAPTSTPTGQQQQQQPRLSYFITRTNGSTVPLVPADELPYTVRLEGVPRNMTPDQTFGMQFLGTFPFTGMVFKAKDDPTTMQRSTSQPTTPTHQRQYSNGKQYMAPDALARQATTNAANHVYNMSTSQHAPTATTPRLSRPSTRTPTPEDPRPAPARTLTDPQDIIDAIVNSKSGAETAARVGYVPKATVSTPPSGNVPDSNKKTFCTYWIRHGECDYMQQGCMYKHEMPDKAKLQELGFRDTPRWWAEKHQAIKLGGGSGGGVKETVGPVMKARDWLRKASVASTESGKSSDSEIEVDISKSVTDGESGKASAAVERKATGMGAKKPEVADKQFTILQKPTQKTAGSASSSSSSSESANGTKKTSSIDDDLIDFDTLEPTSSSTATASTPPTSAESSPPVSPAPKKAAAIATSKIAPSPGKAKEIFVPKGESLADHQKRSFATRRPNKPSEAQVASLEKQIQQMTKNKHAAAAAAGTGAGLIGSRHAPERSGRSGNGYERARRSGERGGRMVNGCRPRRPAQGLRCVEPPMASKMKMRAEEREGAKKG